MIGILFITLIIMLIIGVPVGFSIGISGMAFILFEGFPSMSIIAQKMVESVNSFPLLALPLFMLSGEIMSYGSTPRLMRLANMLIGKIPGGLGATGAITAGFFGAISGSGVATTAAVGGIMAPEMVDKGYGKGFTASLLSGAGSLGIVIPPSLSMVIYAATGGTSLGDLFLAGFIPGILSVFALVLLSVFIGKKRGYTGVQEDLSRSDTLKVWLDALLPLLMPIIIIGGVLSGTVTPTESAAVAVFYSFILAVFVYKELKLKDIVKICTKSAVSSSIILFIMAAAGPFGWLMATQNVPQLFASTLLGITSNPIVILLLIMFLLLFLGTFMETNSVIILLTPMLLPVVTSLGIDPIHFGVIMILNLAIGGTTPPLAVCLFTTTRILNIKIEDTFPDVLYVVGVMTIVLILVTLIPDLALFLPKVLN